jgi:hypothetical protein
MPNEEQNLPGNESELLLQLVSALINQGQPPAAPTALTAPIPVPQQPHGLPRGVIPPPGGFSGYGAATSFHPAGQAFPPRQQQQHTQQLPYVGSSMEFDVSDTYDEPQYPQQERGGLTAVDKRERVRLKNRLAQQRFRERRRALQRQAQDQFDAVAAEFDALEMENDALREEEQALIKLYHVKHHFWQGMMSIKHAATNTKDEVKPNIEAGTEDETQVKADEVDTEDDAGVEKQNNSGSTTEKGVESEPGARSLSHPRYVPPMRGSGSNALVSLQLDAHRTQLFANLQKWQLQLGELMENAASSGFGAEDIKILEAETTQQLAVWQQLATENSCEYAQLLQHLLAPVGMRSPNNHALEAGAVGPQTLTAVVSGITENGIAELQKVKNGYDSNVDLGYQALVRWKKDLLPLLTLSYAEQSGYASSDRPNIGGGSGGGGTASAALMSHSDLATRHVMAATAIAHLHALETKLYEAIRLIGPAWSRVSGPLNAALCHLETSPYLPSPDVMAVQILAKHQESNENP